MSLADSLLAETRKDVPAFATYLAQLNTVHVLTAQGRTKDAITRYVRESIGVKI